MLSPQSLAAALGLPRPTDEQAAVIAAPRRAGARRGRRRVGQDRDDGRPGGLAGRQRAGAARAGPRPDVHPQGRRRAGRPGAHPAAAPAPGPAARRPRPDGRGARRCWPASRPSPPTTRTPAGWSPSTPCGCRPSPAPGCSPAPRAWQLAHRVVTTWADDLDVDRVPAHRHRRTCSRWPASSPSTSSSRPRCGARRGAGRAARPGAPRAAAAGRAVAALPAVAGRASACGARCSRWSARTRRASGPSAAMDFGDQLALAARVAAEHPEVGAQERAAYRAVLLDEYQDTGARPAGAAARRCSAAAHPVTAVGDPCQSIYGWRGASAGNLAAVPHRLPGPDGAPAASTACSRASATGRRCSRGERRVARRCGPSVPGRGRRRRAGRRAGRRRRRRPGARCCRRRRRGRLAGRRDRRVLAAPRPDVGRRTSTARRPSSCAAGPTWIAGRRPRCGRAACRSRWSASAACWTPPRSATWSARCAWSPTRPPARRCCGCSPGRAGGSAPRDLAALWAAGRGSSPGPRRARRTGGRRRAALGALPGEHDEQAGLVDALDDLGRRRGRYSADGLARLARCATELARAAAGASTSRCPTWSPTSSAPLRLDVEVAAAPAGRRRAGRAAPRRVRRRGRALRRRTPTAATLRRVPGLPRRRRGRRSAGWTPGEVEVAPTRCRCSPCTRPRAWSGTSSRCRGLTAACSRAAGHAARHWLTDPSAAAVPAARRRRRSCPSSTARRGADQKASTRR